MVKDVPEQVLDVKANLHKVKVEKIAATLKLNHELNKVRPALFFTGFWTTPTNGFGGFLSLENIP